MHMIITMITITMTIITMVMSHMITIIRTTIMIIPMRPSPLPLPQ